MEFFSRENVVEKVVSISFRTDESTQSIVVVSAVTFPVVGNTASISLMTGDPKDVLLLLESDIVNRILVPQPFANRPEYALRSSTNTKGLV